MTRNPSLALGFVAALALSATAAQAQILQPQGMQAQQGTRAPAPQAQNKPSEADETFITNAIQADLAAIAMGKLAQQNGRSAAVRNFGKILEYDRTANLAKAQTLAQSLGVTAPGAPSPEQQAAYRSMNLSAGRSFDERFARDMIAHRRQDVADFQKEAEKSGQLADYAKNTLPTLETHLRMAESLDKIETIGSR